MKYMEREHSAARRILCLIMAITMLLPVSNLWALEIGIQLLDGGESLIVSSGETVTADDADVRTTSRDGSDVDSVTAVRGDDTDSEYVFNGDVTVEEDGSISATITEDTDLPSGDVFAQGIEADEGDVLITNDGSITASALIEGFDEPHAIGVMIHNFNAAVLEDPETGVVNNGDITASAIQYNSAGAGATARGIQTGGGSNNTFENLTITNNEGATITVHAESKNETASALGIKTGGYIDGLNITNDGTIDADAKGDGETSARGIRVAGNITGDYSIDNNGTITADATSVDDDAIVRGIHVSGYDTSGTVSEDIVIFAGTEDEKTVSLTVYNTVVDPTALTITNEGTIDVTADGDYEANARAIHAGDRYTGLTITNGIDGELIATAIAEEDDANARAIHTGENNTGLDLENKGLIGADASSSTYDASATGIKLGEDNDGAITNSGTIKATASTTAYDEGAAARGIHIGNDDYYSSYYDAVSDRTYYYDDDGSPGDDSVDIINEEGGTISATAAASFGGAAGARGIHAGDDSIGTITNAGTISAVAEGGYSGDSPSYGTKAFAVHTEGGLTLENEGDITADIKLKTQDSDSVSSSRAIGVFVSRIDDTDDDVSIINSSGAAIEATADFQVAYDIDDNPAAIGIKLSDGSITMPTDTDTSLTRSIDNAGEISAA